MSSVEKSALFADDDFKYPSPFDIARYRQLERADRFFTIGGGHHPFKEFRNDKSSTLSVPQALVRYARTATGLWHSEQRARYPSLHANLNPQLTGINPDDSVALDAFRSKMLELIAHDPKETADLQRYGHQSIDLHPIGHMAQVAIRMDNMLLFDEGFSQLPPDAFLIQAMRHSSALHDVGEAEFPGIKLHHGDSVGDIGADVGKSDEKRALEKAILYHIINATFEDHYTDDFRFTVVAMASHDMSGADTTMRTYHAASEVNHEVNSMNTAWYFSELSEEIAGTHPDHANIMTAVAFDSLLRALKKRDHMVEDGLSPELAHSITDRARNLFTKATRRDADNSYISWKSLEPVIEHFGSYEPQSATLRASLEK